MLYSIQFNRICETCK